MDVSLEQLAKRLVEVIEEDGVVMKIPSYNENEPLERVSTLLSMAHEDGLPAYAFAIGKDTYVSASDDYSLLH